MTGNTVGRNEIHLCTDRCKQRNCGLHAGCVRGEQMPESFAAWIQWKLGDRIAQEYMLPYNRKIWSMDPDQLGTYWLHKLPNVSFT